MSSAVAGAAMASDPLAAIGEPDANDYRAHAYWRLDFGGAAAASSASLGLRFDKEIAFARGAPALLEFNRPANGAIRFSITGVDLTGPLYALRQNDGYGTPIGQQWLYGVYAVVGIVAVAAVVEHKEKDEEAPRGTGASGF